MKLRDHLVAALKPLAGKRTFNLHVLSSAPRRTATLYPYAHPRPRIYVQDVFILCSEQSETVSIGLGLSPDQASTGNSAQAPESKESESNVPPKTFVTAIEASIYHIPSTQSTIFYIAKVDSTGQGARQSPTAVLVSAFISYFLDESTRPQRYQNTTLWLHLFARAERQYLFPNSADFEGKKPLSDVKLCSWWKRVLGDVATGVEERVKRGGTEKEEARIRCFYVLPGLNELEAAQALNEPVSGPSKGRWIYGHPYTQEDLPPPCSISGKSGESIQNLGHIIPSFDDDPKSRFMDEIAHTTQVDGMRSPSRKRRKVSVTDVASVPTTTTTTNGVDGTAVASASADGVAGEDGELKKEKGRFLPSGELGKVNAAEFWERMSFRQECTAGKITGFFSLVFPPHSQSDSAATTGHVSSASTINPLAPLPGEISHHVVHRVVDSLMKNHEFSTRERAVRATSLLENVIKGLCSGSLHPASFASTSTSRANDKSKSKGENKEGSSRPVPEAFLLDGSHELGDEKLMSTMATDVKGEDDNGDDLVVLQERTRTPPPKAPSPTHTHAHAHLAVPTPKTPPRRLPTLDTDTDITITPNPFPDPEPSESTYNDYIFQSVGISNPEFVVGVGVGKEVGERKVTMLAVRKKKR